jgi:hypothetical protein
MRLLIRVAGFTLALLFFTSCSYLPWYTQKLPWESMDALKSDVVSAEPALCSGNVSAPGMMFRVAATHEGTNYLLFVAPAPDGSTVEMIVAAKLDADGKPVRIYYAKIDETNHTIQTLESHPFNSDKDQGPCQVLFPSASN